MEYKEMTKEELITVIEKLNKKLYHKQAARLSWKKLMNGTLATGADYWSNGHFALYNTVPMPEAINKLKDIYPREVESSLESLITSQERTPTNKDLWIEREGTDTRFKEIVTEHGQRFQASYIAMIEKLIPDFSLELTGEMAPALIYSKGELMGLLMPLRDKA